MTEEEKKQLENHFESALNDLVSEIKDTTATEVVMREQQMILFYKRVMLEIEKRDNLISKLQADIDRLEKKNKRYEKYLKNKDEEHEKVLEFIETEKEKLQSDIEIKDKVIDYIAKHTYIRTGENGVLGTITEEVIEHLYKKVEEEKC